MKESEHRQKIKLCQQVLEVLDIVDPGLSMGRGLILFELHSTVINVANLEFEQTHNHNSLLNRLQEAKSYLLEAGKILSVEPQNSTYGQLASSIKPSMTELAEYIQTIQKQAMYSES